MKVRKLLMIIPLLIALSLSGRNAIAQKKDSVTVSVNDLRNSLQREDRLRVAFNRLQVGYNNCDSTSIVLKKQVRKEKRGKNIFKGTTILAVLFGLYQSLKP